MIRPALASFLLLLCFFGGAAGLRLRSSTVHGSAQRNLVEAMDKQQEAVAADGPFSKAIGSAFGSKPAKCRPAPPKDQPMKLAANVPVYDQHWNEFCPAWGGKIDPHTNTCRIGKEDFVEESLRANDCYFANQVHKKIKKTMALNMGFTPPGIDDAVGVMDAKVKQISTKSTPTYFEGLLDQDKDSYASYEDFKSVCTAVNKVNPKSPAAVHEFVITNFPFLDGFTKEMGKVSIGNFKVNLAQAMGWKMEQSVIDNGIMATWGYLCSECSRGSTSDILWDPELFNQASEVLATPAGQKIETDLSQENLEKVLRYARRVAMWRWGFYCDENKKHAILPGVSSECSAVMTPDPKACG